MVWPAGGTSFLSYSWTLSSWMQILHVFPGQLWCKDPENIRKSIYQTPRRKYSGCLVCKIARWWVICRLTAFKGKGIFIHAINQTSDDWVGNLLHVLWNQRHRSLCQRVYANGGGMHTYNPGGLMTQTKANPWGYENCSSQLLGRFQDYLTMCGLLPV